MKQIDRLVSKEIIGPWIFGIGLFTSLLLAGTYLNRIADYIVKGVPPNSILELTLLLLPAIVAKTFGMSMLLAALLAFGRLSSDSEVVAMRAAGASIFRIVLPVMAFSLFVSVLTFVFNEGVVPPAAKRAKEMLVELAEKGDIVTGDPVIIPLEGGKAVLSAKSFNLAARTMSDVTMTTYDDERRPNYVMLVREMEYRAEDNWHIRGTTLLLSLQGGWKMETKEAWPSQIPKVSVSPQDIMTINNKDLDLYSMAEIRQQIDRGRREVGSIPAATIANLEYGYWSKISVPLAAFVFGTLGAVLGIRNARTGTATGFALAVGIIFGYMMLANFMTVWAQGGVLPTWVAAFLPVALGFSGAMYLMWRRNA
jgi:lipopolysaccharide export system permease protein